MRALPPNQRRCLMKAGSTSVSEERPDWVTSVSQWTGTDSDGTRAAGSPAGSLQPSTDAPSSTNQ